MIHSARPPTMWRSSVTKSGRSGAVGRPVSRERKENLLEAGTGEVGSCPQLGEGSATAQASLREQNEAIAYPLRVGQLVDREYERTAVRRLAPEQTHNVARLARVEAVERLVHGDDVIGGGQPQTHHHTPAVTP